MLLLSTDEIRKIVVSRCLCKLSVHSYFVLSLSWEIFYLTDALQQTGKVIGGKRADITEFPSFAAVFVKQYHHERLMCGATYIKELWLLTAAHCLVYQDMKRVLRDPQELLIRMGMSTLNGTCQERRAVDLFKHNEYPVEFGTPKDIGLIRIDTKFNVNDRVAQAELVNASDFPYDLITVGFGNVDPTIGPISAPSFYLQKVELEVKKTDEYYIECYDPTPRGVCFGDSGGPLYVRNNKTLVGIVSRGTCGLGQGFFVNGYRFRTWILNRTNVAVEIRVEYWSGVIFTLLLNLLTHKIKIVFSIIYTSLNFCNS